MKNFKLLLSLMMLLSSFIIAQDVESDKTINVFGHIGQMSPLTSADRASYNAGASIGVNLSFPNKEITIFKHPFSMGMELNFSKLDGNQSSDLKINTIAFQLLTAFDKLPVDFIFGFGLSNVSGGRNISGLGAIEINHRLPIKKLDFSIGIKFQQVFDLQKNYRIEHMHGLYGLNIKFGKTIKYNKK